MNWKTWIPLVLAIVFAVVAAKAARDWMIKNKASGQPAGKFTKVVVAAGDIEPGKAITAADLTTSNVEVDRIPANSFTDVSQLENRVSESAIAKNSPIVEGMLAPTGTGSGLQALVPNGMRAITMEVNEFSGVAGLIMPGCRVDVIATINSGDSDGQLAKTIVQNVKVTAIGQRMAGAEAAPPVPNEMSKSVTVLVSLAEAEAIELACSTGRPRLVLRSGRDNAVVATAGISLGALRMGADGGAQPQVVVVPPIATTEPSTTQPGETIVRQDPPRRVVRIIRGTTETNVTLDALDGAPETNVGTDTSDPFDAH